MSFIIYRMEGDVMQDNDRDGPQGDRLFNITDAVYA